MQEFVCLEAVTTLCERNKEYPQYMIAADLLLEMEFILCILLCTNTAVYPYSLLSSSCVKCRRGILSRRSYQHLDGQFTICLGC